MAQSVQAVPSFIERRPYGVRSLAWPTQREWMRHGLLFAVTILTTTFAGVMLLSPAPTGFSVADPHSLVQYLTYVPRVYATEVVGLTVQAIRFPSLLTQGLTFSASLLAILTAHEFGHYFACRRYRVNAT